MTACAAREAVKGEGGGTSCSPVPVCSTRLLLGREGWGEEGSSPGHGLGQVSLWSPPSPCCWPQAFLSSYNQHSFCAPPASWFRMHNPLHQEGSGGLGAPMCAGALSMGCPGMGTRGTHWNVPGKGNLWDTSCSRGHSGSEGSSAWAANLTIISALSSCHLGSGSSGQWQAAAGSGLRGQGGSRA